MECLKRHLNDYEDSTKKEPKAERTIIHKMYEVLSVAEIIDGYENTHFISINIDSISDLCAHRCNLLIVLFYHALLLV